MMPFRGQNFLRVFECKTSTVISTGSPMPLDLAYLLPNLMRMDFLFVVLVLALEMTLVGVILNQKMHVY